MTVGNLEEDEPPSGQTGFGRLEENVPPSGQAVFRLVDTSMSAQRYQIATKLIWVTVGLSVAVLVTALLIPENNWARVDGIIPLIIAPFQTLLGAAIGWYFSERTKG